jgi:glycosyltransferase involved in cell wall biosynthesis
VGVKIVHLSSYAKGGAFAAGHRVHMALRNIENVHSEHIVYTGDSSSEYTLLANTWIKQKWAWMLHAWEKFTFLFYEKSREIRFDYSHGLTGIPIHKNPTVLAADIIHLHWINKGFISLYGLQSLLKLNKKIVWTAYDMWPFTGGCYYAGDCENNLSGCHSCKYLRHESLELSARKRAQKMEILNGSGIRIIANSQWLKEKGSAALTNVEVRHIYAGINTSIFSPIAGARNTLGFNTEEFVVAFVAENLGNARKGMQDFVDMLPILAEGIANLHILFVGTKKQDIIAPNGVKISYTGFIKSQQEMALRYSAANAYITTSLEDNLPGTVMESLACATPVFAYAIGGIAQMTSAQRGGLAQRHDFKTLAKLVVEYAQKLPAEQSLINNAAREFALENFDIEKVAQRHLDFYLEKK